MTSRTKCRKGLHSYGHGAAVGGGIIRRSCSSCGTVQMDVRSPETVAQSGLFTRPRLHSMFYVEVLLTNAETEVLLGRSFGRPPAERRRPAAAVA